MMKQEDGDNYVKRTGWTGHVYNILIGEHEWKRSLGMPRYRWKDNIKIYVKEVVCVAVD
jgi:hypothetical protein